MSQKTKKVKSKKISKAALPTKASAKVGKRVKNLPAGAKAKAGKVHKVIKPEPHPVPPLTNFPVNTVNPFVGKQFMNDVKSVSVMATDETEGDKITKTVTRYQRITKNESLTKFCDAIKETLDITSGGIKTFRYLYEQVQQGKGLNAESISLAVDKYDCMKKAKYTSIQSVFNGINELLEKEIIAKSGKINVYFMNPNFFRPQDFLIITEYYKLDK